MRTIKPSNPCYLWAPAVLLHRAEEVSILNPDENHHDFEDENRLKMVVGITFIILAFPGFGQPPQVWSRLTQPPYPYL